MHVSSTVVAGPSLVLSVTRVCFDVVDGLMTCTNGDITEAGKGASLKSVCCAVAATLPTAGPTPGL